MSFTVIAAVCFVLGVALARRMAPNVGVYRPADRSRFWWFCLLGGWFLNYGLSPLYRIPSISAASDKASAVWMLGVLLGLRAAMQRGNLPRVGIWFGALMVYPVLMLLFGGFLSYGSAAAIIVCSALTISTRSYWRVAAGIVFLTFFSLSLFVVYFAHRNDIRHYVWGGAPLSARIGSTAAMVRDFEWLDLNNQRHLHALDARLNQNYFAGLAAERIRLGRANYLYGGSVWEGVLALVPRLLWPDKPVFAGSPAIVSKMTGLTLSSTTSFGIGNLMEFQINFGLPGVVIGFLLLGWLIGFLDRKAAFAEREGDFGHTILFFLPAIALIEPNGSIIELCGGAAAALVGAFIWKTIWEFGSQRSERRRAEAHIGRESSAYRHQPAS